MHLLVGNEIHTTLFCDKVIQTDYVHFVIKQNLQSNIFKCFLVVI